MPGRMTVSFRRDPSFFQAAVVEGSFHQAVVARQGTGERVIGLGCRSVRTRYVNGLPRPIGYLSSLRLLPEYRGTGIVAHAYRHLRTLHEDRRTSLYLSTIAEGNELALSMLNHTRVGLPRYHFAGNYHTLAIPIRRSVSPSNGVETGLEIREATGEDAAVTAGFLSSVGPTRQFFPQYEAGDFFNSGGTFCDLKPQDLLLAFRQGRLIGTLACWNQSRFRQTVVEAYGGHLQWTRPFYNSWARLRGLPQLPPTGEPFQHLTAALPVVRDGDPVVFARLLQEALSRSARKWKEAYLLLGLHERDPLLPVADVRKSHSYRTRLYHVCWDDGESLRAELDDRPPYLELGCL